MAAELQVVELALRLLRLSSHMVVAEALALRLSWELPRRPPYALVSRGGGESASGRLVGSRIFQQSRYMKTCREVK